MRLGLFKLLSAEVRTRVLAAREAALERHGQRMEGLQQGMELGVHGEKIIQHRREQIKAELNWVTRVRQLQRKVKGQET